MTKNRIKMEILLRIKWYPWSPDRLPQDIPNGPTTLKDLVFKISNYSLNEPLATIKRFEAAYKFRPMLIKISGLIMYRSKAQLDLMLCRAKT